MSALRHVRGHPFAGRAPQAYSQYAEEPKEGGTRLRVAQSVRGARWMIAALQ
jgi:hypothetical protein